MDFLKGLNAQQREAVSCTEGPLLILAGAGSGKTRVITHRIAHIIASRHVPPSAILAVTVTNKAAGEMRERVRSLLADMPLDSEPRVSTFHSFCGRLLRTDGEPLARIRPGFTRRFSIYDDDDQLAIVKSAYRSLGLEEKEFMQYRSALARISHSLKGSSQSMGAGNMIELSRSLENSARLGEQRDYQAEAGRLALAFQETRSAMLAYCVAARSA